LILFYFFFEQKSALALECTHMVNIIFLALGPKVTEKSSEFSYNGISFLQIY